MNLTFQINYRTQYGQNVCIIETKPSSLGWTEQQPLYLNCHGGDFWTVQLDLKADIKKIEYKYAIRQENGCYTYEQGLPRTLAVSASKRAVIVRDQWQNEDEDQPFYTTAFQKALFRRPESKCKAMKGNIHFQIDLPQILPTETVVVMGNTEALGNWDAKKALRLQDKDYPIWRGAISEEKQEVIEYKYCLIDTQTGEVRDLEWGENRQIWGIQKGVEIWQNDRHFRRTQPRFKGAGVAIPVFSLRSEQDLGIGEFLDLKPMADWASCVGLKMIQTLPINDTTLTHTYTDSYPYNAVSVFALHPIYLNIPAMGRLTAAEQKRYKTEQEKLNGLTYADYPTVYAVKEKFFLALYKRDAAALFKTKEYQQFAEQNKDWLPAYAEFLSRRDKQPKDYYCFLQYHADRQLREAVDYAHRQGVSMKGDIPIGISPDSVDAYTNPELFNLNASAGAPPDDFSISGQNWGFPTYNWDEMAKDNYAWWRRRFQKMEDYFDAYRIDHILGFFRIWQMRKTDVWGLMGHFCPALPYSLQDLWNMGVKLDEDRMTRPYIRANFLGELFGYDTERMKELFLDTHDGYVYFFRPEFDTQRKVEAYFNEKGDTLGYTPERLEQLKSALYFLHSEVLFVRDQKQPELLHPRISIFQSYSFRELYADQREVIARIYNDYFFHRHNDFWWASAMKKLPTLIHSTGMLCCGEDLGMVPDCVPDVMHRLQILSLEIQRMPKDPTIDFAHPADAPYMSVCTTGTHDTNPIRAWWEEDREVTQKYWNQQMGRWGEAPQEMSPEIAEAVLNQHVYSPAMWVILPLQDWMAIDGDLRLADAQAERINVPANPKHFWKYRMHLTLEQLKKEDNFNQHLRQLTQVR